MNQATFFFDQHIRKLSQGLSLLTESLSSQKEPTARRLNDSEILVLKNQGCRAENWATVCISPAEKPQAKLENIHNTSFSGKIILNQADSIRIENSRLRDCFIGAHTHILDCSWLEKCWIEDECSIRNSSISSPESEHQFPFGIGSPVQLFNESYPTVYRLQPADTLEHILSSLDSQTEPDFPPLEQTQIKLWAWNYMGKQSQVFNAPDCRNIFLDSGCRIDGALQIHSCAIMSSILSEQNETNMICRPVLIGPGCIIRNSAVQPGCFVDSSARIFSSLLLETAHAENGATITNSIIGPGSQLGQGETTACLVGPLVAQHHQSLLIAADWRGGRGNIGYGANIGSNHSSRLPDQHIRIGEGCFLGLNCGISFPASLAPYSLVASGTLLRSQRIDLPFSLVLSDENGANRIIPAWGLQKNMFAILRNQHKMAGRWKALCHSYNWSPFRQSLRLHMQAAIEELSKQREKQKNAERIFLPETGCSTTYILTRDVDTAIAAYQQAIRWGELTEAHATPLSAEQQKERSQLAQDILEKIRSSRQRDFAQEQHVFPDKKSIAGSPEDAHLQTIKENLHTYLLVTPEADPST